MEVDKQSRTHTGWMLVVVAGTVVAEQRKEDVPLILKDLADGTLSKR